MASFQQHQAENKGLSFADEYQRLGFLGEGGYGKVYHVRNKLDRALYAVKEIIISAEKFDRYEELSSAHGRENTLMREVRALAKYDHPHIVRYHHAWIETMRATEKNEEDGLEDDDTLPPQTGDITRQNEQELSKFLEAQTRLGKLEIDDDDIFERGSPACSAGNESKFFRGKGNSSSSEEEEEEEGEGAEVGALVRSGKVATPKIEYHLFIKMAIYPLTLGAFLTTPSAPAPSSSPSSFSSSEGNVVPRPRHCFHPLPSLRLLLCILSGVEYLHNKKQLHRDLKPANIFLRFLERGDRPKEGFIDINDCPECRSNRGCNNSDEETPCWVCPCIGDFGLVADLKDYSTPTNSLLHVPPSSKQSGAFTSTQNDAGTALYIPPENTKSQTSKSGRQQKGKQIPTPLCEKRDTYSLGIIFAELLFSFATSSERVVLLGQMRANTWSTEVENTICATGIKGMLEVDRSKRWGCAKIRSWAEELVKQLTDERPEPVAEEID